MPATIHGLALHPLLVHAVVVLVPLSVIAAVAVALSERVRSRHGWLLTALVTLALVFVPLASGSGESLAARVHMTPLLQRHTELGGQLLPLVFLLWVAVVALMFTHRWGTLPADGPGTPAAITTRARAVVAVDHVGRRVHARWRRRIARVAAVVAVLAAVATAVQVYRIGDSGARAVWHGVGTGPVINPESG
jgi:uncharacterized membrane protein